MSKILQIQNLFYSVDKVIIPFIRIEKLNILSDISFDVLEKEIIGIAGESGSGKTTLAKIICGILVKSEGDIIFPQWKLNKGRINPVQLLFQNTGEILNPLRNVDDIISEIILLNKNGRIKLEEEKIKILESVDLPLEILERKGNELSGGQQQRVALARLLAAKPKILILDEPFSSQDIESQINFVKLFKKLRLASGITLICISHNLSMLINICDRIVIMQRGKIVEQNDTLNIFNNPQHSYTKLLLKASGYDLSYNEFTSLKD